MTPSKPTVPVSGRVPALPEDMTERVAQASYDRDQRLFCTDSMRTWAEQTEALHGRYRREAHTALTAAGVPGLVQRLTEAEAERDAAREGLRLQGDALGDKIRRLETAEELLREFEQDAIGPARTRAKARAFLSVGEGRSREPDGDAE